MPPKNWETRDWLLVITLVGGFLIFFAGIGLMLAGTNAEGVIDLKSSVISGTIRTGSAGLFVCAFGVSLIIATLLVGLQHKPESPRVLHVPSSRPATIRTVLVGLAVAFLICIIGAALTSHGAFIGASLLLGVLMLIALIAFVDAA